MPPGNTQSPANSNKRNCPAQARFGARGDFVGDDFLLANFDAIEQQAGHGRGRGLRQVETRRHVGVKQADVVALRRGCSGRAGSWWRFVSGSAVNCRQRRIRRGSNFP